jgi:hypothetical protein
MMNFRVVRFMSQLHWTTRFYFDLRMVRIVLKVRTVEMVNVLHLKSQHIPRT